MAPVTTLGQPAARAAAVKPLTLTSAVEQYAETTDAIDVLSGLQKKAKEFLLEHGKKTGRRTFLDRVAMVQTGGNSVLDQAQAQKDLEEAGLPIPKKTTKLGWTLKLLEKPPGDE